MRLYQTRLAAVARLILWIIAMPLLPGVWLGVTEQAITNATRYNSLASHLITNDSLYQMHTIAAGWGVIGALVLIGAEILLARAILRETGMLRALRHGRS